MVFIDKLALKTSLATDDVPVFLWEDAIEIWRFYMIDCIYCYCWIQITQSKQFWAVHEVLLIDIPCEHI